jgi:hypothetical protein
MPPVHHRRMMIGTRVQAWGQAQHNGGEDDGEGEGGSKGEGEEKGSD